MVSSSLGAVSSPSVAQTLTLTPKLTQSVTQGSGVKRQGTSWSQGSAHLLSRQKHCATPLKQVVGETHSRFSCCTVQTSEGLYFCEVQHQGLQHEPSVSRQQQVDLT
ncbi:hypothetical protein EON64_10055 [archaeon]|nr:MAG: hypothetical protein EON64_10055 [archaeon]